MAGTESPAPGDAIPVLDVTALALDAALKKLKSLSLGGTRVTPQGARALQSALPGLEVSFEIDPELEGILEQSRGEH